MYSRIIPAFFALLFYTTSFAQVSEKISAAFQNFIIDSQLRNASVSLYVTETNGNQVFAHNENLGLAPASTLKIITGITAFELLGPGFKYETKFGVSKSRKGTMVVEGTGDPSLGSWRWSETKGENILARVHADFTKAGHRKVPNIAFRDSWEGERTADGWIWQDIGNYYGAGAGSFNWRENQFDIVMSSPSTLNQPVTFAKPTPFPIRNYVKTAAKGTGDNTIVYPGIDGEFAAIRGTIPVSETAFSVSASHPHPEEWFRQLYSTQQRGSMRTFSNVDSNYTVLHTHYSPTLDSLNFYFQRRSINLYGEAFLRTVGHRIGGIGSEDKGIEVIKTYWEERGIDPGELAMRDGSGLAPLNRVTTSAQVHILRHAMDKPYYQSFYHALPTYNAMKMKSGTISAVKGFCGYHTAKDGKQYVFSFLVNNYHGSHNALVSKMYKVLDELK